MARRRWRAMLAVSVVLAGFTAACTDEDGGGRTEPPPGPPAKPTVLTLGVYGEDAEIDAYRTMIDSYNDKAQSTEVKLQTWPDRDAIIEALEADHAAGKRPPDLFLLSRRDLARVTAAEINQPLFELLDERGVSYGDRYSRDAVESFSADDDLQCMPYSISPMVMYYNTDLIDFERMRERELPAPEEPAEGWTFDEFRAAAEFASRPRRGTRGVHVDATLRSLAPFVWSGGGSLFDDETEPTSLTLSQDEDRTALTTALEVLRDPRLTLTDRQLERAPALEWFKRGKLGMIEGFRSLTPMLRDVPGLHFDVMPMPTLDDPATIGDITGLCIARGRNADVQAAADFMVHAISDDRSAQVAEAGYIVPANETVSRSEAFLQPDRQPASAGVFNLSVGDMRLPPVVDDAEALNAAVEPLLQQLLTEPVLADIEDLTAQIDEASRSVLDPDYSPSETPDGSPSDGESSDGS
jgi:multiple sugar transport system substrate-binding protein